MTISRLSHKFAGLPHFAVLTLALGACSGAENPVEASGGGAGSAGAAGSGSSGVSGSPSSGGSSGVGEGEVIGAFQVGIKAATSEVSILGKVSDAALPPNVIWEVTQDNGDCRVKTPSVPFCDPGCGGDICQPGNLCVPYPEGHSVGEVTLSGVQLMGGASVLVLKEVANNYQPPPNTSFAFPPFSEGDEVEVHAAGGDYPSFDLAAAAVAPLSFTSDNFALQEDTDLELTWQAASDPTLSRVLLKLDISHHGGTKGMIECDTDDDGALTLSGALLTELIGLGVAGFPTVELTRVSTATASITPGRVELKVSAFVGQAVTIAGLDSCTATSCGDPNDMSCIGCPAGLTCQTDLTCQ